jgi:hypothetical protein
MLLLHANWPGNDSPANNVYNLSALCSTFVRCLSPGRLARNGVVRAWRPLSKWLCMRAIALPGISALVREAVGLLRHVFSFSLYGSRCANLGERCAGGTADEGTFATSDRIAPNFCLTDCTCITVQ